MGWRFLAPVALIRVCSVGGWCFLGLWQPQPQWRRLRRGCQKRERPGHFPIKTRKFQWEPNLLGNDEGVDDCRLLLVPDESVVVGVWGCRMSGIRDATDTSPVKPQPTTKPTIPIIAGLYHPFQSPLLIRSHREKDNTVVFLLFLAPVVPVDNQGRRCIANSIRAPPSR